MKAILKKVFTIKEEWSLKNITILAIVGYGVLYMNYVTPSYIEMLCSREGGITNMTAHYSLKEIVDSYFIFRKSVKR
jgi:hypothetical protein